MAQPCAHIIDQLYLGSELDALSKDLICALDVKHILNVAWPNSKEVYISCYIATVVM